MFLNNKDKTIKHSQSGVYKLDCLACSKRYVGRTCRNLKIRLSEHKRCFDNDKVDSTYSSYLQSEKKINEDINILHRETNFKTSWEFT